MPKAFPAPKIWRTLPGLVPVALLLAAAVAAVEAPVMSGSPLPLHIRWADGLGEAERTGAAREFGLTRLETRDDGVWLVQATDTSTAAIRALVQDPRVVDTHNVDRAAFTLARPRITLVQWLGERSPGFLEFYERHLEGLLRVALIPLVVVLGLVWAALADGWRGRSQWLARGIPEVSPHALAAFRIAYGVAMIVAVSGVQLDPLPRDAHRLYSWIARNEIIREISASATGASSVRTAVIGSLALFAAGVAPRVTLVLSAALLTLFAAVMVTHKSVHDWGLPVVAMWLLVAAPWQEGFGLSWMWRRWRGAPEAASANPRGLALWLPGLALGAAFAAAAFAKLDTSGLQWITGGAVRYHFIEDAVTAPVRWGLAIASSENASVLVSLGAILAEAGFVAVMFFRQAGIRLLFGLVGAAILAGSYLFQGVWWPAWWALLTAFLPWSPVMDALARRLPRLTVLADGECPMCRRTARALHALDWFDRLTFADASDDAVRARVAPGLDRGAALAEMYVIDEAGTRAAGYEGYLRISAAVPLLWIPGLIGLLSPVAAVGRRVYRRVAESRIRRGRCTDDVCGRGDAPLPVRRADRPRAITRAAALLVGLFMLQQIAASALRFESEPFMSDFPMYSFTWPSREAFDEYLRDEKGRYELSTDALSASELDARLRGVPNAVDVIGEAAVASAVSGKPWPQERRAEVDAVLREYRVQYGEPLGRLYVTRRETPFDWRRGAFAERARVTPAGVVDLDSGTESSRRN